MNTPTSTPLPSPATAPRFAAYQAALADYMKKGDALID